MLWGPADQLRDKTFSTASHGGSLRSATLKERCVLYMGRRWMGEIARCPVLIDLAER